MNTLFLIAGGVAVVSAAMAVSRLNAVHALLYLIVSFLALGLAFFLLGAPFAAVLEVIIYAGAIMVLFIFVVMMCNVRGLWLEERNLLRTGAWVAPVVLVLILTGELIYILWSIPEGLYSIAMVGPKIVSVTLFGPYILAVELVSILLLAALVGGYHLVHRTGLDTKKERMPHG